MTGTRGHSTRMIAAAACALLVSVPAVPGPAQAVPDAPAVATPAVETLDLKLGGRDTSIDLYRPATAAKPGAVILVHGFTRTRATMRGHAEALARAGWLAVAPDLPYAVDSRDNARALRDLIEWLTRSEGPAHGDPRLPGQPAVQRVVLIGFSAGGLAALLAADAPHVAGYIGLDPFDRPSGVGAEAARRLQVPAYLVRAPSSACNAYAIAEPWVAALPNLVEDRVIERASHCDFEAPTDWLCRMLCGRTDAARQQTIREAVLRSVERLLATGANPH
jgi:dienelactone hydrolase